MAIETIVFDLDGVIRHFDADHRDRVEAGHGLPAGSLWAAAFSPDRIGALVTGAIRRAEWIESVGQAVDNPTAAQEWLAEPGRTDDETLAVIDWLRADGYPVSILTNGTDTVPAELEAAGILDRIDHLFNTASIGVAKPDPAIFDHVGRALDAKPGSVFFTDDSAGHVAAAGQVGWVTHHFTGAAGLRAELERRL